MEAGPAFLSAVPVPMINPVLYTSSTAVSLWSSTVVEPRLGSPDSTSNGYHRHLSSGKSTLQAMVPVIRIRQLASVRDGTRDAVSLLVLVWRFLSVAVSVVAVAVRAIMAVVVSRHREHPPGSTVVTFALLAVLQCYISQKDKETDVGEMSRPP